MGGKASARVPYLRKVDNEEIAAITNGVCFCFGNKCNMFFSNGKLVGNINYVGKPGPGMQFVVDGKKNSVPGDLVDKYVELLTWKGIPVPMME